MRVPINFHRRPRQHRRIPPKQNIHVLQRNPFGLRHTEIRKHEPDDRAPAEKEKGPVLDVRDHVRDGVDDRELSEPLHAHHDHVAQGADTRGQDLRRVDPRDAVPGEAVEDGEDVDHGQGCAGAAVERHRVIEGPGYACVRAQVEHGNSGADCAEEEGGAAAGAVHEEEHVD